MNKKKIFLAALSAVGITTLFGGWAAKPCENCECDKKEVSAYIQSVNNPEDANPKITAKAGFLLEANSGEVLFAKDENKRLPIASMTKIATLGVIYDAMANGEIKMEDKVLVSPAAGGMGGSQAFLDTNSEYTAAELIKSIVIASANDSCVAMAEKLYGSETAFVAKMNELANKVGATNTNFVNCTGLPAVGAYSSAGDIAKLYAYIMKSPNYGDFNKVWMYDLTHPSGRITGLTNTNKLARFYNGCEGGKTGYTAEAGHCIAVTAARAAIKPIAVIIGAADSKTRFAESSNLLNYAFDNYENKLIVNKDESAATVKLRGAVADKINIYPAENFYKLTKKGGKSAVTVNTELPAEVVAPVKNTDAVGKMIITQDGKVIREIAVTTKENIEKTSFYETLKKVAKGFHI
jgi:D-alanyl-D-alanine carboxypeptidase (penicillin-binding protein 5/6)